MTNTSRLTKTLAAEPGRYWLYAAVLAAVILRVVWAAAVPVAPISDSNAYDIFATNLAAGDGFGWTRDNPSGFFAPGAAFIYAVLYSVFGHSYWPIVVLHIIASAASVALLWCLTKTWFGTRAANVAAWTLAIWPSQVMFVTILATELIFNFLLLVALWIWTRESLGIWVRGLLLGPVLALSALIRPHALLLPAFFAIERLVRTRKWVTTTGSAAIAGLLMVVILLPWSLRNEHAFGERFLVSANFGTTLWMGNNPQSIGEYMPVPDDVKHLNDAQRDRELKRRAVEYIKSDPAGFVRNSVVRLVKTHSRETINVAWNIKGIEQSLGNKMLMPLKAVSTAYWYAVLLAAAAGVLLLLRREGLAHGVCHPTVLLWTYFAAIHAVILSQDRYHFISIPMIAALAGFAVASLLPRLGNPPNQVLELTR